MANPETNIAAAQQAAERDAFRQSLTSDSERAAFDSMLSAVAAPAAPADLPANAPIPGGYANADKTPRASVNVAPPSPRLQPGEYYGDPLDIETRAHSFPGVAVVEMQALREAVEAYEDHRAENDHLLRDTWITDVTEKEAREVAEYINAGKPVPKDRESLVTTAMHDRPIALATARKLAREVRSADSKAIAAINRELPDALPRVQAELNDALDEVEAAVSAMSAAAARVQALHGVYVPMAIKVKKPLPTAAQGMYRNLLDLHAVRRELDAALRSARGRVPRPAAAE